MVTEKVLVYRDNQQGSRECESLRNGSVRSFEFPFVQLMARKVFDWLPSPFPSRTFFGRQRNRRCSGAGRTLWQHRITQAFDR